MYESPIEAIYGNMIADNVRKQAEDYVMYVIADVGIKVDKDELIKALKYDRNQYEKGYADGQKKKHAHWIDLGGIYSCSHCGSEDGIETKFCSSCGFKMDGI